jgi:hypothetical protein
MRRAAGLVAVAALALTGACAPGGSTADLAADGGVARGPDPGPSGISAAVLERWADFPVGRRPRPIVLIGQLVRESGYRTDDAKVAMATGRITLRARLPDGPATVPVSLPDGTYHLRAISATQAFTVVARLGDPKNAPGSSPAPLAITTVTLGSAIFPTDRGQRALPAWLFDGPDLLEPLAVPALDSSAFYRPGDVPYPTNAGEARLARDGASLTATLPAPPEGACPGDPYLRFVPEAVESTTAVAVGVRSEIVSVAPGPPRDDCGYLAIARNAEYRLRLTAPLGDRLLVGSDGAVIPVRVL